MAAISLATAQSRLSRYLDAEDKVLDGQSVSFADRSLTRADLPEIQSGIERWSRRVERLTRGGAVSAQRMVLNG